MTSIPDFTKIDLAGARKPNGVAHEAPAPAEDQVFTTPEGIPVKPIYTDADTAGLDFLDTWPGIAPFVRGSIRRAGRCHRSSGCSARSGASMTPSFERRSTVDWAWC